MLILLFSLAGAAHATVTVTKKEGAFKFYAVAGSVSATTGLPPRDIPQVPMRVILNQSPNRLNVDFFSVSVSWSQLFGEMVENYAVEWRGDRQRPFFLLDQNNLSVSPTWAELGEHKDLLLSARHLKPRAVDFQVRFEIPQKEMQALKLGAQSVSGVARVTNESLLLARSGESPLQVSGIRDWDRFLVREETPAIELVKKALPRARSLVIHEIRITRLEWPDGDMRLILAKLRTRRDKPEKSPAEKIAAAEMPAAPFAGDPALAEPYEPAALLPTQSPYPPQKWGLRDEFDKVVLPFRYDQAPVIAGQTALVREQGQYALINFKGEPLYGPSPEEILRFPDGFYVLKRREVLHEMSMLTDVTITAWHLRKINADEKGFKISPEPCVHLHWRSSPNLFLTANDPNLSTAENERLRAIGRQKNKEAVEECRRIYRAKSDEFAARGYRLIHD
jgi:hypothetical protein